MRADPVKITLTEEELQRLMNDAEWKAAQRCIAICQKQERQSERLNGTTFYIATGQCAAAIRHEWEQRA